MRALLRRFDRALRGLTAPADRVALAVSGGADSVALAWLVRDLVAAGTAPVALAGLIHVHHGLRGEDADRDEAFVRALAARLGTPVDVTHVDVRAAAASARQSMETTARGLRDRVFPEAAARLGASWVATAHTADDQAETVLLRLLRGAGARGVGGIRPRRGCLIRPLLDVRRAALRADLDRRGEGWREDRSNADRSIPRNALRHDLLPVLDALAPGGTRALGRFAALARDDEAFLEKGAIKQARTIVLVDGETVRLGRAALGALHPALARRVVRLALEQVNPTAVGARAVDAIRALARADTTKGRLDVPGLTVEVRPDAPDVLVVRRQIRDRGVRPIGAPRPLSVPGSVGLPEAGVQITAAWAGPEDLSAAMHGRGAVAVVQQSALHGGLSVRSRRPGDRLRPLGAPGRRKVQDVLVDRKVPRAERDRVPIVVDDEGRIVWVAGHAVADECRVTAPESGVVLLKISDL